MTIDSVWSVTFLECSVCEAVITTSALNNQLVIVASRKVHRTLQHRQAAQRNWLRCTSRQTEWQRPGNIQRAWQKTWRSQRTEKTKTTASLFWNQAFRGSLLTIRSSGLKVQFRLRRYKSIPSDDLLLMVLSPVRCQQAHPVSPFYQKDRLSVTS